MGSKLNPGWGLYAFEFNPHTASVVFKFNPHPASVFPLEIRALDLKKPLDLYNELLDIKASMIRKPLDSKMRILKIYSLLYLLVSTTRVALQGLRYWPDLLGVLVI